MVGFDIMSKPTFFSPGGVDGGQCQASVTREISLLDPAAQDSRSDGPDDWIAAQTPQLLLNPAGCFKVNLQGPLQPPTGQFPCGDQQSHRLEPYPQRYVCVLKDRACQIGEHPFAAGASVMPSGSSASMSACCALTEGTDHPHRPAQVPERLPTPIFR